MIARRDSAFKAAFDALCNEFGISECQCSYKHLCRRSGQTTRIPFEIRTSKEKAEPIDGVKAFREIRKIAENGELPDLSLEEINEKIRLARAERR